MSAFEIKKDISRLSKVIRSAQNNGGLLRGLAPRASWTRLINALEGFNQIEAEHVKMQRAASEDTTASVLTASSTSDAMIQADLVTSEEPSSATSSKFSSPSRIIGTEVFIPCSSSIKCLTWQQEEPTAVPMPPCQLSDEEEEYASCKMTPPTTPSSSSSRLRTSNAKAKAKGRHFNFPLPVKYPVTQQLDHASRISERIHRSFTGENMQRVQIEPMEVQSDLCKGDSPLIRERIPTLVSPKNIGQIFRTCSERTVGYTREKYVPVRCKSVEQILQSDEDCSESSTLAEFGVPSSVTVFPFEHTDMDWASEEEMQGSEDVVTTDQKNLRSRYRTVHSGVPKRSNVVLNLPPISPEFYFPDARTSTRFEGLDQQAVTEGEMKGLEIQQNQRGAKCRMIGCNIPISDLDYPWIPSDETYYFPSESILSSQSPTSSSSSASSLTKVPCPKKPVWVHVIPEESNSIDFLNESISDMLSRGSEDRLFEDTDYPECRVVTRDPPQIPSPSSSHSNFGLETFEDFDVLESVNVTHQHQPKNGIAGSKFRNHFKQEYLQMEEVGKRLNDLKQLMQMSRRFDIAKPYLDKISSLDLEDHSQPDPQLDAEITDCCGWNVDNELQKVNTEITSLNKLLRTGIGPLAPASRNNPCRRDSSTSTATVASTSSTAASHSTGSPTSPRSFPNPYTSRSKVPKYPNSTRFPSETVQTARISYSDSWTARNVGNGLPYRSHEVMSTSWENSQTVPTVPAYLRREYEASHPAWRGAVAYVPSNSSLSSSNGSSGLMGLRRDTPEGLLGQVPPLRTNPLDLISNCSTLSYYQNGIGPLDSSRSVSRDSNLSVNTFSPVGHGSPRQQRSEVRGTKVSRHFQGSNFYGPDCGF